MFAIRFTKKDDVPKFKEVFEQLLSENGKLEWPKAEKKEEPPKEEAEEKKEE